MVEVLSVAAASDDALPKSMSPAWLMAMLQLFETVAVTPLKPTPAEPPGD